MSSDAFGSDMANLRPIVSDNFSDSGNFDSVLEVLCHGSSRNMMDAVMLMLPKAWQNNPAIPVDEKALYQYNSCVMEPWDGPAMMAFSDGKFMGAVLDRNGLRPCRYYETHDGLVLLSSEVGVVHDIPEDSIKRKGRVSPGRMFLIDFEKHEITEDVGIKEEMAAKYPYKKWVEDNLLHLSLLSPDTAQNNEIQLDSNLIQRMKMFNFSVEDMDFIVGPMANAGKEPLGSMGNDAALACLSSQARLVSEFFKQLFAQVHVHIATILLDLTDLAF